MKRHLSLLAALFLAASSILRADEGMWMLPLLQKMNAQAMADLGCRLTAEQIYSINNSSLKDAIVHFGGGCTAEMISGEGLLVTNHHCGYSGIQSLSTPEHNYLEDGYWAMTRDKELPVPGLSVTFLGSMTDVTDILGKLREQVLKDNRKSDDAEAIADEAVASLKRSLIEQAKADNPGSDAVITSFYNENVHYLIVSKTYRDVRFVGAPPASLGKFGGETDNWEWPRHTCDFSMFRVYAGADNQPSAYSPDNVPYVPARSLRISLKGVQDGDFAMIMGYPGRTQRFQTADQLESMMYQYGVAVKARTVRQSEMLKGMEKDPAIRLKYANKYASSSNAWKKWQGEQLAFDKLKVIEREREKEAQFRAWASSDRKRAKKYGAALDKVSEAVGAQRQPRYEMYVLSESVARIAAIDVFFEFAETVSEALAESDDTSAVRQLALDKASALFKDYDVQTEKDIAVAMLGFLREYGSRESWIDEIGDFGNMDFSAYVERFFEESAFASPENLEAARTRSLRDLMSDPAAILAIAVYERLEKYSGDCVGTRQLLEEGSKEFAAGLLEWKKDEPSYPDANSTMRLTYGTVKSYSPRDGVLYRHYTTLNGVMEKEDPDNYEFRVPSGLKALHEARDYGQYADADGELHTCFLTNCDITGGNSGSPVLNADGELIGLAFDGNWESMSSDVMFEPELQRCICVDIRYVLFIMDKFGGAGHLLDEMNISR